MAEDGETAKDPVAPAEDDEPTPPDDTTPKDGIEKEAGAFGGPLHDGFD